jgi:hypothetical protein
MPQELFILRKEHEEAFACAGLERFIRRLHAILKKKTLASAFGTDNQTPLGAIRAVVVRARDWGLKTERQMSEFAEAEAIFRIAGSSIDDCGQCQEVLKSKNLEPAEKSQRLLSVARRHSGSASLPAVIKR